MLGVGVARNRELGLVRTIIINLANGADIVERKSPMSTEVLIEALLKPNSNRIRNQMSPAMPSRSGTNQ